MFVLKTVVVTKLLVSDILFSSLLVFQFKTVVVSKPLVSGIFLSASPIFSRNFVYLCCID